MNDIETAQAVKLANDLQKKHASKILFCANALNQMRPDRTLTAREEALAIEAFGRIFDVMPTVDEPRFSMHDYIDGIANARNTVDLAKLWALDDACFAVAMIWLAADKRETYEERRHVQDPLELDIYA